MVGDNSDNLPGIELDQATLNLLTEYTLEGY